MYPWVRVHPLVVRITHWINAFAVLLMLASGWKIYTPRRCSSRSTFPRR